MTILLHLDVSVRGDRSLSRRLSRAFVDAWSAAHPHDDVLRRDLAADPPPFVDEGFIAAAFTKRDARTPAMHAALAWSEAAIAELEVAEVIVLGTPMFNYGMPARLKAWVDQVVRVDRTFSFDLARGDWPLRPMLSGKTLVLLSSAGEFGFAPGGLRVDMNHLDPHLQVVGRYLGTARHVHLGVEYQEFGDDRHAASLAAAVAAIPSLVVDVTEGLASARAAAATVTDA